MRERPLPKKKPGDTLSARHVNTLSMVVERLGALDTSGVGAPAYHGASSISLSNQSAWQQFVLIVTDTKINDDDTDDSGLYLGKVRWYSDDDSEWKDDDDQDFEIDTTDLCPLLAVGDKLVCQWDAQRQMFIPLMSLIRRFELRSALTPGGSATVKMLYWDEDAGYYGTSTTIHIEVEFDVWDTTQHHEQYAVPEGVTGAYGYAKFMTDSGRWEIIEKQPCARSCEATLVGAMDTTDATWTVDNVVPIDGGFSPVIDAAATLTVTNRYDMEGDDDGECEIYWDGTHWAFRQCKCKV